MIDTHSVAVTHPYKYPKAGAGSALLWPEQTGESAPPRARQLRVRARQLRVAVWC